MFIVHIGRDEKLSRITADILPENLEMQRVSEKIGFKLTRSLTEPMVRAEINLT